MDRQKITELFIETLNHLLLQLNFIVSRYHQVTYGKKTDAIVANGAIKIFKIENSIASELNSQYKTMHLLCKSPTVEALDRSNLDVFSKIGKQVNHRGTLENINPNLK